MKKISIGDFTLGQGKTYVIAEAGSNHNGELRLAKELIDAAAEAKADAVKFQAFRAADHYSKHTPNFTYLAGEKKSTYDLIKSLEINREWHQDLMEHAKKRKIEFLSSPCDVEAIEQLAKLGMSAFKLASFDLPDLQLIRLMARHKRPLIFSTGMADYYDIQRAIHAARQEGNDKVVLLQCTSLYPAPVELSNLTAMHTMAQAFSVPVGYSDHTLGEHICLAAVALGAVAIEKHFTLDRNQDGPDHVFAMEPGDLKQMIQHIREIESAKGDGIKDGPRAAEQEMFEKGRRSLHTGVDLKPGQTVRREDLRIKRPGFGVAPHLLENIVGMKVTKAVAADHWLSWDDFK